MVSSEARVSWENRFAVFVRNKEMGVQGQRGQKKWESFQRNQEKRGLLSVEKKRKLYAAGFDFQPQENLLCFDEETWMEKFELLKAFKRKKGNFPVPHSHPELGNWARNQRQTLKVEDGLSERMKERRALLIQIGFWNDLSSIERDDSDAGTECLSVVDGANSPSNDSAEVAPSVNSSTDAAEVAPALSPGDKLNSQWQDMQNQNRTDAETGYKDVVRDSKSRRNGTGLDSMVLLPGEKENGQLQHAQSLKRAGNTKVTDRHDKLPRLGSPSRAEVSVPKILPFPNHKSVREVPMDMPLHSKGLEIRRNEKGPSQETKEDMLPEPSEGKRGMISFHSSPSHDEDVKMAASHGKTMAAFRTKTFPTGNVATSLGLEGLPADNRAMKAKAAFATSSLRASDTGASAARQDKGATAKPVSHAPSGVAHGTDMTFRTGSTFAADALPLDHPVKSAPSQGGDTEFQLYLSCYLGLKDEQKALLNDCGALVDRKKELDGEQANLSMRIDPSIELVALESESAATNTMASLKEQASAKEDHGHCPERMKALLDQASDQVKEAKALKIQLRNQVDEQEKALAKQLRAFQAWEAELGRIDARLARINAIREQHIASLPEILHTANESDS
jgi:Helicase associated domain